MPKNSKKVQRAQKKPAKPRQAAGHSIRVGNISGGTGIAIGKSAKSSVVQISGVGNDEISKVFGRLNEKAAKLPESPEKTIVNSALKELEQEARKGDQANENTVQKWMMFLSEAAPDIWDIAVETFINPVKGIATVFRKIAERSKAKGDASQAESK